MMVVLAHGMSLRTMLCWKRDLAAVASVDAEIVVVAFAVAVVAVDVMQPVKHDRSAELNLRMLTSKVSRNFFQALWSFQRLTKTSP